MTGNSFGKVFRVSSFGESHGPAVGCVIDGCPAGMEFSLKKLQNDLYRRMPGKSIYVSQRKENDEIEVLSGVFKGKTLGSPIALMVRNHDHKSQDYTDLHNKFRPGHGDYCYFKKYNVRDYRGGGRASARETIARVAAGAVAKHYLSNYGINFVAYLTQIGPIKSAQQNVALAFNNSLNNPFSFADEDKVAELEQYFTWLRKNKDSVGAKLHIVISGAPVGLGEPVFDKLDALLTQAWMSIPAVKAVEIGAGFAVVEQLGSVARDAMQQHGFVSNNAGGILAGISTGQDIHANLAFKPTSSIPQKIDSIDEQNQPCVVEVKGRHDPCVAIRAAVIAEAMAAIVIMDLFLQHRGQYGRF